MRTLYAFMLACALLFSLASAGASAQTRGRRTTTPRRRAAATTSRLESAQVNAARLRLADQIKNLSRFLYLYGRFSKDLELSGAQAGDAAAANRTRASLLDSLRNIRDGLDQLEAQFRLTPGLERQYAKLAGVAQRASEAESQAAANRLDQAGRALVEVVNQLTDVLLEM